MACSTKSVVRIDGFIVPTLRRARANFRNTKTFSQHVFLVRCVQSASHLKSVPFKHSRRSLSLADLLKNKISSDNFDR